MHKRHLLKLCLGVAFASLIPSMGEAGLATQLDADQCVGLTVMCRVNKLLCRSFDQTTAYACQRGWYVPPTHPSDCGLRIDDNGQEYYPAKSILPLTPAGRAHGEHIVREWAADKTAWFHESACKWVAEQPVQ